MCVLLIEDDPSLALFYSRALKRSGYEVTAETRGDNGLAIALRENPEVVVLDWCLPGLNGIEVIKQLRARGYENPILMLSGSCETARDEALEAGANAFLPKPCGLQDLTNCVDTLTNRAPAANLPVSVA